MSNVVDLAAYRRSESATPAQHRKRFKMEIHNRNGEWINLTVSHLDGYREGGKRVWRLGWNGRRFANTRDYHDMAERFPDIETQLSRWLRDRDCRRLQQLCHRLM